MKSVSFLTILMLMYSSVALSQPVGNTMMPSIVSMLLEESAICGNAVVEATEVCDDGNGFSGDYCEVDCKALGPLAGLDDVGRWGLPENTFVLDKVFHFDLQASYPQVNWQTLDRLYIPAGEHSAIWLGNLPVRSPERPLIITNFGGQVKVTANGNSKFVIEGGSNWVLTGRYDPGSATGHASFIGHANGNYANSPGNYGIYIEQGFQGGNGVTVREGRASSHSTDFELEYIEVAEAGFAAINIKNDNAPTKHMRNVKLHDLYLRDAETECLYIGNTGSDPDTQHRFDNLLVFNNRGVRCGAEGIQLSHIGNGSRIFNNVIFMSALDWKDPFLAFQEGQLQVTARPGNVVIENNIFIGGVNTMISPRLVRGAEDPQSPSAAGRLLIRNNYFAYSRGTFYSYIHNRSSNYDTELRLQGNFFGEMITQRSEIVPGEEAEPFFFQTKFNKNNPLRFIDNIFEGSRRGYQSLGSGINGTAFNLVASGNTNGSVPAPKFNNSGFAARFDYRKVEVWSDCAKIYSNRAIGYEVGDVVSLHGKY